jgi:hypothetical protein
LRDLERRTVRALVGMEDGPSRAHRGGLARRVSGLENARVQKRPTSAGRWSFKAGAVYSTRMESDLLITSVSYFCSASLRAPHLPPLRILGFGSWKESQKCLSPAYPSAATLFGSIAESTKKIFANSPCSSIPLYK